MACESERKIRDAHQFAVDFIGQRMPLLRVAVAQADAAAKLAREHLAWAENAHAKNVAALAAANKALADCESRHGTPTPLPPTPGPASAPPPPLPAWMAAGVPNMPPDVLAGFEIIRPAEAAGGPVPATWEWPPQWMRAREGDSA